MSGTPEPVAPLTTTDPARLGIGVGTIIGGRYEVTRLLGAGGMGAVFEARHTAIGRVVAIKVLRTELAADPTVATRFVQEARTAAALHHRNIVEVLDFGSESDGRLYLVMEMLHGESLQDLIDREAPLAPSRVLALVDPVMRALDVAHERGVIHRDVKPDNIFLAQEESGEIVPKLLDFGIARHVMDDTRLTRTGISMGTPAYMAPEQAAGVRELTAAVDQYALGAILYEALTGRVPHEGDTYNAIIIAKATAPAVPLDQLRPDLDAELVAAVMRALARQPADRFASLKDMREALANAALDDMNTATRAMRSPISRHAATRPDGAPAFHDTTAVPASLLPDAQMGDTYVSGARVSVDEGLSPGVRDLAPRGDDTISRPVSPQARAAAHQALHGASATPTEPPPPLAAGRAPTAVVPSGRGAGRPGVMFGVLGGLSAVAVGVILAVTMGRSSPRPTPPSSPVAPPVARAGDPGGSQPARPPAGADERVTFTFDFEPANAEITLGGERLGAGHAAVALPRDGRTYQLRVSAPGFVPYTEVLTADGNARIAHPLAREDAGAGALPALDPNRPHGVRPPRPPTVDRGTNDPRHPRIQRENPI